MKRLLSFLAALVFMLSACSQDAEPKVTGPDLPACDDIWVIGETLPEDYRGCVNRDGKGVAADKMSCGVGDTYDWGEEWLYWYEDDPLSYVAWSADGHDYPVEREIEDGNQITRLTNQRVFDMMQETCREQ